MDAGTIVSHLQASGLPITNVEVYTAANDENKLLGRPGQYVSKANWRDKSDTNTSAVYTVETFANVQDRDKRMQYVHGISSSASLLAEYEYTHGLALMRLSHDLTPDQAAAYDTAMKATVGN